MKKLLAALIALTLTAACLPAAAESISIGSGASASEITPIGGGASSDGGLPIGSGVIVNETMPAHSSNYGFILSGGTLYTTPGGGSVVTTVTADDVVLYDGVSGVNTADGALWVRVITKGTTGYVPVKSITFMSKAEENAYWEMLNPAPTATPTPVPTASAQPTATPLVSLITPTPTDQVIGRAQVTTASGSLNLRRLPSYGADVIGYIPQYSIVEVFEYDGGWARIRYNGATGWVLSSFLTSYGTQPTARPTTNPGTLQGYAYVSTNGGGLNLREYAGTGARVLTVIPRYAQVEVFSYGSTWCFVRYNGITGYVMTNYLSFSYTPVPTATPVPTVFPTVPVAQSYAYVSTNGGGLNLREYAGTGARVTMVIPRYARVEVLSAGSTWSWVRYNGVTGYVMTRYLSTGYYTPTPTTTPTASTGTWAIVATQSGGLNIREASYVGARILKVAPKGATVTVLERGTTWSRISYGGVTGYAMTGFLSFNGSAVSVTSSRAIVSASGNGLKLYTSSSTASTALCTIPARTEVSVLSRGERWTYVRWGSYTGYVLTTYLTFLPD